MRAIKIVLLSALVVLVCAPASIAADYSIDPVHSQAVFTIRHLDVNWLSGRFHRVTGAIDFDPRSEKVRRVDAEIEVRSLSTDVEERDSHLLSEDFFGVVHYPAMTFVSKSITYENHREFKVVGTLRLHGVSKEVVLDATFQGRVRDMQKNERIGFTATTRINRSDFGMTWFKKLPTGEQMVGDEVRIYLEVEGVK